MPQKTFHSTDGKTTAIISEEKGLIELTVMKVGFHQATNYTLSVTSTNHVQGMTGEVTGDPLLQTPQNEGGITFASHAVSAKLANEIRAAYQGFKKHKVDDGKEAGTIADFIEKEIKKLPQPKKAADGSSKLRDY